MKQTFILIILLVILLSSCGTNPTPTPPPTLEPTPTATPIPFSELRLDEVLIQPYDLPSGVSGAQISYQAELAPVPPADYYIQQELAYRDNKRGLIQIWVYEDPESTSRRYEYNIGLLEEECARSANQCHSGDPRTVASLGEAAQLIAVNNYIGNDAYTVVFFRCHAVITASIWAVIDTPDGLIAYAQRLDERLTPIVCR